MDDLISRAEAIDALNALEKDGHVYVNGAFFETILRDEAERVLRELPSAEKTQLSTEGTTFDTTFDCISRTEAIRIASGYCHPSNIAKELKRLPSAQPEIIRCKDCKYMIDTGDDLMCDNTKGWVVATASDFGCVLAERRTDDRSD